MRCFASVRRRRGSDGVGLCECLPSRKTVRCEVFCVEGGRDCFRARCGVESRQSQSWIQTLDMVVWGLVATDGIQWIQAR